MGPWPYAGSETERFPIPRRRAQRVVPQWHDALTEQVLRAASRNSLEGIFRTVQKEYREGLRSHELHQDLANDAKNLVRVEGGVESILRDVEVPPVGVESRGQQPG